MAPRARQAALATCLAAFLYASAALAQEPAPCVKHTDFLNWLSTYYDERPIALGLMAGGRVLEVVASDSGSWTIIVTMPNGISCGIASGKIWTIVIPEEKT